MDRQKWGLAGLLAFEAIVTAYLLGVGATMGFVLSYAAGAVLLGFALAMGPQRWQFGALALLAGYRALVQTAGGTALFGVYPTWLVPIGFAWLAIAPTKVPRAAIACIALARTWFILWYVPGLFVAGSTTLVVANVLGAAGAWLWLASDEPAVDGDAQSSGAPGALNR